MATTFVPGQRSTRRGAGVVPVNLSLDKDALVLLRQYAPSSKAYGHFLSRLLYQHDERQRSVGKMTGAREETAQEG